MATFIIRYLRNLFDVDTTGAVPGDALTLDVDGVTWVPGAGGGGGGAPANATYLVGAADATLTNEIVVGATPGGELGNTWASPTVDTVHSGSSHAQTQAAAEATAAAALLGHTSDPTDAHDASAISFVPVGTIAATDVQAAIAEAAAEASDLTGAVILAPASSARNVIQPTAGAVIAAIIKAHAAQSVDLTQWQDSASGVLGKVDKSGNWTISPSDPLVTHFKIISAPDPGGDDPYLLELVGPDALTKVAVRNDGSFFADWVSGSEDWTIRGTLGTGIFRVTPTTFAVTQPNGLASVLAIVLDTPEIGVFGETPVGQQTAASVGDLWAALKAYGWLDAGSTAPTISGAPTTATYITQTPDAGLSAEQALSALATGLVKNTTGTGVLSIGVANTDYAAAAHASRHQDGGADEISLTGLSGAPADTVNKSLYDANTVLAANSDDTPAALTMGASTILARLAAGNIVAATPAQINTLLGWTTVTKASDESVASSTVLQADDELIFTAVSGGIYEVEAVIIYASPAGAGTPDLNFSWGEDNTNRGGVIRSLGLNSGDSAATAPLTAVRNNPTTIPLGTAAANRVMKADGIYVGGGGTFAFMWAQNTSGVNATTVRAGSVLRYRRIL